MTLSKSLKDNKGLKTGLSSKSHGQGTCEGALWYFVSGLFFQWVHWVFRVGCFFHGSIAYKEQAIGLGSWDLGNKGARSKPSALCHAPRAIPECYLWSGRAHYPAGSGRGYVSKHPHECQDPKFPSRTLRCNKKILLHTLFVSGFNFEKWF